MQTTVLTLLLAQCKMALPSFCQKMRLCHIVTAMLMLALAVAELISDYIDNCRHYSSMIARLSSIMYASYILLLPCKPSIWIAIATALLNLATMASTCAAFVIQKTSGVETTILLTILYPIHLSLLPVHFIIIVFDKIVPVIEARLSHDTLLDVTYTEDGTNIRPPSDFRLPNELPNPPAYDDLSEPALPPYQHKDLPPAYTSV